MSSSAFGGELDDRFNDDWDFFFELGRMGNVAASALDARAQVIGNAIGATQASCSARHTSTSADAIG